MVPGTHKKTKAKRSCLRVRRMQMKPGEYHKLKLRTASGGSLTIRYRKTPGSCSSGDSSSGEAEEASSSGHASDESFAAHSLDENQAFENLEDLLEYSQSCVSGVPAHVYDAAYGCEMQPNFSSYHFWSSEECNSSDIGSNEVLQDLTADSINIPTADPVGMRDSLLEEQAENGFSAFEETQCYSLEQNAMLIQKLRSFTSQGIELASTLVCMESHEQVQACRSFWSFNQDTDSGLGDGQPLENTMPLFGFPPLFDQAESSEIELLDLPLLHYDATDTMCGEERTLHDRYEHAYRNEAAGCAALKEDAALFDEDSFLLLDPGMPDEVSLMNSVFPQSPWSALLEDTLQEVTQDAVQIAAGKEAAMESLVPRPPDVKEAKQLGMKPNYGLTWEDGTAGRKETHAAAVSISMGEDSSILSDPVASRGKKLRKKRLRRATPLNTLRSLLSVRDEAPRIQRQRRTPWSPSETNSQDLDSDSLCSAVTKRNSNDSAPGKRLTDHSGMVSTVDSGLKGGLAHVEKVSGWRCSDQIYRNVHEIHNALSLHESEAQKRSSDTSSEDELANQGSAIALPSQRRYHASVTAALQRRNQESGKRARRSDGRGRSKFSSLLPEQAVATLRKWFDDHIAFPFADKEQKLDLVSQTGLTLTQVENWLSNYRHRLKVRRSDYDGNVFRPEKACPRQ